MTGYVDWEGAGHGDRAIDLSRLLYDAYVSEAEIGYRANPATLKMLQDKIRDVSGTDALNSYMSYWILQVSDYGTKAGPDLLGKFLGVGRRIVSDLQSNSVQNLFSGLRIYSIFFASMSTKQIRAGASVRLLQAWFVPL